MNRPRRFESKKAPEQLQALDKNDSGDSADDDRGNSLTIMTQYDLHKLWHLSII